jgi:hypothetical protein
MSWNNVTPAHLLASPAIDREAIKNPNVTIPLDLLVACHLQYSIEGAWSLSAGSADHPAFAELRKRLEGIRLIEIPPYACWNGDRVIRRFQFNGIQLERGDTFYCAAAWQYYKKDMKCHKT